MTYAPRIVKDAAKHVQEYFRILESQLTTLGLKPRQEIGMMGNSFRVAGGFGCIARIHFMAVGNDVIVAPEVVRSIWGIVLAVILLPFLILPGIIVWLITRRNVQRTMARVMYGIESSISAYKAQFPEEKEVREKK